MLAQFYDEVLFYGPTAVLPQNLSSKWLRRLQEISDDFLDSNFRLDECKEPEDIGNPKRKKPVKRTPRKKEAKSMTAADTVLKVIGRSKKGVSTSTIMERTGLTRKQVSNIVFKLKKQGKIKSVQKGVYVKS